MVELALSTCHISYHQTCFNDCMSLPITVSDGNGPSGLVATARTSKPKWRRTGWWGGIWKWTIQWNGVDPFQTATRSWKPLYLYNVVVPWQITTIFSLTTTSQILTKIAVLGYLRCQNHWLWGIQIRERLNCLQIILPLEV